MLKITFITVCYNAIDTLEKTILSIINQTYPNIEYIIIDGASTDGTVDIIKKYEHKLSYWISEPDKGIYDAMNKGLKRATGDYINFMNADDILLHIPYEELKLISNDNYGKNTVEDKKKILVEYVSANPTGPLHIGHGRWAAIGSGT